MTIALYMDEHVHKGITDELRQRGVDVLTVQEDGRTGTPDLLVLDRATELQRVIFTQDQDFIYAVSLAGMTGKTLEIDGEQRNYLEKLSNMNLRSPSIVSY